MARIASAAVAFDPAVNMARQALYRFAALSLVDPRSGSWHELRRIANIRLLPAAAIVIRTLPDVRTVKLGIGELPVRLLNPTAALSRLPDTADDFNAEYETVFGLVVGSACPPYETEYIGNKFAFQRSNSLADISGFYHAFGLAIPNGRAERPDHVALELEFMASLLALERRAAEMDSEQRKEFVALCHHAQVRFLNEHIAWWLPAFARLLVHESKVGFYAAVGSFLAALIPAERALLGIEPSTREVAPSRDGSPDACDGCQLV